MKIISSLSLKKSVLQVTSESLKGPLRVHDVHVYSSKIGFEFFLSLTIDTLRRKIVNDHGNKGFLAIASHFFAFKFKMAAVIFCLSGRHLGLEC